MKRSHTILFSIVVAASMLPGTAWAELCGGPLNNNNFNRPLDYNSNQDKYGFGEGQRNKLALVETYHFDSDVEMLIEGINGPLPGDIHYTLMHFPNHHRALNAMANWHLENPNPSDEECDCLTWLLSAECYFTRALTFRPRDSIVYYVLGIYLHNNGELDRALEAYTDASNLGLRSPEFNYNFGLLYVDLNDFENAREYAARAYSQGVPFPGLRNKLESAGEWQ